MPPTQEAEPPVATDAERWVLGSMLLEPATVPSVMRSLGPLDFAAGDHRRLFESVSKRHRNGQPIDPVLIARDLKADGITDAANLLAEVGESVPTAAHAGHYAAVVRDAALKRRIYDAACDAMAGATNGHAGTDVLTALHAFADDELRSIDRPTDVERFTIGQLVNDYPRLNPPVVDGLFRQGETCNIIAASKVGKSWFAYSLALAIATGRPWLDRYATAPGRVLIVDNELHRQTLASRIPAVCDAMGVGLDAVANDLTIWPLRGNLRSLSELAAEFDSIEPGEYQAIIMDAKYRLVEMGASENDNAAETRIYNLLDQIAAKTKAAIVVIHHASKGEQAAKAVTDVGAGAGAQSRASDCHLVLRPHEEEGCAVLDAAVRSFAPVEPLGLRWEFPLWLPDAGLDAGQLKGKQTAQDERQAKKDAEGMATLVEVLGRGEATRRGLRTHAGMGPERCNRLVLKLLKEGRIVASTTIIEGNETDVFHLPE